MSEAGTQKKMEVFQRARRKKSSRSGSSPWPNQGPFGHVSNSDNCGGLEPSE